MRSPSEPSSAARLRCELLEDRLTPAAGTLVLNNISSVRESAFAPVISVTVTRTNGTDGAVSATVSVTGGTATPGADFAPGPYPVAFADGQTTVTLTIPVVDDALSEPTETVSFTLSAPTGGAVLGDPTTGTARIADDDGTLIATSSAVRPPGAPSVPIVTVSLASQSTSSPSLPSSLQRTFTPFAGFTGTVFVALGDVNGDGVADAVAGASVNAHVKVLDGRTGAELRSFLAYPGFVGAVRVATGDVNGDGVADIITGAGTNTHVKVFNGRTGIEIRSFLAYPGSSGSVDVAAGDINGDGRLDIVTGAAENGHVKAFDGATGAEIRSFLAYNGYFGPALVAAADINGDGRAELIAGAPERAHVKAFDAGTGTTLLSFYGMSHLSDVAAADADEDGLPDILLGQIDEAMRYSGRTGQLIPPSIPLTGTRLTRFDTYVG